MLLLLFGLNTLGVTNSLFSIITQSVSHRLVARKIPVPSLRSSFDMVKSMAPNPATISFEDRDSRVTTFSELRIMIGCNNLSDAVRCQRRVIEANSSAILNFFSKALIQYVGITLDGVVALETRLSLQLA